MQKVLDLNTVEELKRSSRTAFKKIYYFYNKRIFYFINTYTRNIEICEELTEDVFIKLWKSREKIQTKTPALFKSYLYAIAKNSAIDFIRQKKVPIFPIDLANNLDISENNEGELNLILEDESKLFEAAIDRLSPRKKEVYLLHRFEDLTYKQISSKLGISVSTVENHITAAYKEVKAFLYKKSL